MNQFLKVVVLAFVVMSCTQNEVKKSAIIHGEVLSGKAKNVELQWMVDNPISKKGEQYVAKIDSIGKFAIEIPLERLSSGRIVVGRFYHDICILPGDDFFVRVDGDTIAYTGVGAAKNNFLYECEKQGLSEKNYYAESNKGELTPVDFVKSMEVFKQKRTDFLNAYQANEKIQKEYVDYFLVQNQVISEKLIQGYPRRYAYKNKLDADSIEIPAEMEALKYFSTYVDDSKVISSDYIHNLRNEIYTKAREIIKLNSGYKWDKALYVALFDSLQGKTREYVAAKWICNEFSRDSYDTIAIERFNALEVDSLARKSVDAAMAKYHEKRALIGQPLHVAFSKTQLRDTSYASLTFGEMMEAHKGHVVYVDFWGMGCGPCRAAMPYEKVLKEKLAGEPIDFVYISMESIRQKNWEDVYAATFTKTNHYIMQNGFQSKLNKFMEINWVPCYMIFDKEGKLVDFNADRPSSAVAKMETKLEKTLRDLAMK